MEGTVRRVLFVVPPPSLNIELGSREFLKTQRNVPPKLFGRRFVAFRKLVNPARDRLAVHCYFRVRLKGCAKPLQPPGFNSGMVAPAGTFFNEFPESYKSPVGLAPHLNICVVWPNWLVRSGDSSDWKR